VSERPLVAFTLLAQTAVGAFVTLGALEVWAGALTGQPAARALTDGVLLAIGPVMVAALAASLLHLGAPAAAWRAVANVRRSWLSREVVLAVAFALAGGSFAALRVSGTGPAQLRTLLAVATALAGIALVYAMARVYRVRTIPAWDTPLTTTSFFAAALLLGTLSVGTGLVLLPGVPDGMVAGPLHGIALAAAAGFGAELALRGRGTLHGVRRVLLLVGLALSVGLLLSAGRATALLVAAFAVALAAEVLGRYLFYTEGSRKAL
jgi:anaerobic dimethyl sulfoxide reductase subunit C (anchor subunit)